MDRLGDLVTFLFFLVFVVFAIVRKYREQQQIMEQQKNAPRKTPAEMPDATKRMIFGNDVPVARPRAPEQGMEGRPVRHEFDIPTAQPRQGQQGRTVPPPVKPRPVRPSGRPAPPPVQPKTPPRAQPAGGQTPFRPAEAQRRVAEGPKHRPAPEPQRRETPPMPQRGHGPHRRKAPPPVLAPVEEGPAAASQAFEQAPPMRPAHRRDQRRHGRMFHNLHEVRRGIILKEILGPPKAFE